MIKLLIQEQVWNLNKSFNISRGAKIMAEGTLENPIIMTSISDNIELGGTYPVNGPSLTVESRGLWGGLFDYRKHYKNKEFY